MPIIFDRDSFSFSQGIAESIIEAVDQADKAVIFCSSEAMNSEYVQYELNLIRDKNIRSKAGKFLHTVVSSKDLNRLPSDLASSRVHILPTDPADSGWLFDLFFALNDIELSSHIEQQIRTASEIVPFYKLEIRRFVDILNMNGDIRIADEISARNISAHTSHRWSPKKNYWIDQDASTIDHFNLVASSHDCDSDYNIIEHRGRECHQLEVNFDKKVLPHATRTHKTDVVIRNALTLNQTEEIWIDCEQGGYGRVEMQLQLPSTWTGSKPNIKFSAPDHLERIAIPEDLGLGKFKYFNTLIPSGSRVSFVLSDPAHKDFRQNLF
jgi:hypothetical protein